MDHLEYRKRIDLKSLQFIIASILVMAFVLFKGYRLLVISDVLIIVALAISVIIVLLNCIFYFSLWKEFALDIYYKVVDLLATFMIVLAMIVFLTTFLVNTAIVNGDSMSPTIEDDEKILIFPSKSVKRFDIVVLEVDEDNIRASGGYLENNELLIKRLIGLPGDYLKWEHGFLYVNDEVVDDEYLENHGFRKYNLNLDMVFPQHDYEVTLGDDEYFVLGDNRLSSLDSSNIYGGERTSGNFKKTQIKGVVLYIVEGLKIKEIRGVINDSMVSRPYG